MGWANKHIEALQQGKTVQFRPHGNSMSGKVESGQLVTVIPVVENTCLEPGDIVLVKVNGSQYLHLVKAVSETRFQIANNKGHINGWVTRKSIYGKCVKVEP